MKEEQTIQVKVSTEQLKKIIAQSEKKETTARMVIVVPTKLLEKFKFLCDVKGYTQKILINDYLNFFLDKFWTKEINTLYNKKKEAQNE